MYNMEISVGAGDKEDNTLAVWYSRYKSLHRSGSFFLNLKYMCGALGLKFWEVKIPFLPISF